MPVSRNRAAESKAAGRNLRTFDLSPDLDALIDAAAAHVAEAQSRASGVTVRPTRVAGLEFLIREGSKKIPKKKSESA